MNLNDLCKSYKSERVRVCGGSQHRPEGLRDPPSLGWVDKCVSVQSCKNVHSDHVPHLGDFYKCRGRQTVSLRAGCPSP